MPKKRLKKTSQMSGFRIFGKRFANFCKMTIFDILIIKQLENAKNPFFRKCKKTGVVRNHLRKKYFCKRLIFRDIIFSISKNRCFWNFEKVSFAKKRPKTPLLTVPRAIADIWKYFIYLQLSVAYGLTPHLRRALTATDNPEHKPSPELILLHIYGARWLRHQLYFQ